MRVAPSLVGSLLLIVLGCTSGQNSLENSSSLDGASCKWPGKAPRGADVTYLSRGRLLALSPAGGSPECLFDPDARSASTVTWGPQAERVLLSSDFAVLPSSKEIAPFEGDPAVVWSKPEGKSLLAVTSNGRLLKRRTIESEATDISFLARHDEAVYHPAGRHIISVGTDKSGQYGLVLATNQGEDARKLALAEEARRIYSLVADPAGDSVYYAADHGTYREIHWLGIESPELGTIYKTDEQIVRISELSGNADALAVELGSCESRTRVLVAHIAGGSVERLGGPLTRASTQFVGWLPSGDLVILARDRGCDGKGDLYVARRGAGEKSSTTRHGVSPELLARNVEAAGVRAVGPPPPQAPGLSTDPPAA